MKLLPFGESSRGKTADSGSAYRGSNPLSPAITQIADRETNRYQKQTSETDVRIRCQTETSETDIRQRHQKQTLELEIRNKHI